MAAAADQGPRDGVSSAEAGKKRLRYLFGSIDDYENLEVLGEGTYGVVYKARDRRTGQMVAVKWVRGEGAGGHGAPDMHAFTREARYQAACRGHPSIVEIQDVAEDAENGDMFLVMEFVGPSLWDNLKTPFSEEATRVMMWQLVGAAKKMHDAGIIHRDIKPENVLVGSAGELKLCDFGMATLLNPAGTPYEEGPVGTLPYNSPEQLTGSRYYGTAVDMWALGCVMTELLTADPMLKAETLEDLLAEVSALRDRISSTGTPTLESMLELSQAGREVLAGLLEFDPDERLTAAEALDHRWFAEGAEFAAERFVPLDIAGLTLTAS